MTATMMDVPLTLDWIADRAERYMAGVEIVSRRPDKSLHRTSFGSVIQRAKRLARGLIAGGIKKGDRVATLMWNHAEHLEAYFGIPLAGATLHTLNLRLHPDEISYIARDAGDRWLIVDESLHQYCDKLTYKFEKVIVVGRDYEQFIESCPAEGPLPVLDERGELGMCYTSGTTGKPKGVVYSHRSTILHSLVAALPDSLDLRRTDTLLPVVPMFHVNAWGLPFIAAMVGTKLVMPGPHLDPPSLLELLQNEKVTVAAGVPTIWIGIRDLLDKQKYNLQPGLRMIVGGSAAPEQLIRDFDRHDMYLLHAWGMTETSPIGSISRLPPELAKLDEATRYRMRAKQGLPPPLVDLRVRNEAGDVPHDDTTSGEVLIRGPWIAGSYVGGHSPERWTSDGFFRTGDVARVDAYGFVQLTDRIADLIKSGGEWIASAALEHALMGHPCVREAAVIGVAHPKWSERPLAAVVLKEGKQCTAEDLRAHLQGKFAKFWVPDAFVFVEAIPRTSAGKFKKTALREQFKDWKWT
ncbi:MAG: long-chain fatty acid--CoA ligase [Deltaproteobacteria bacterium]|nr:long-chain fatty acid--CoA ligase [Deltaproteobacteria bacterium]